MTHMLNFLKGACVGIANIIPGVSGGTIAVIVGFYEKLIYILCNIFSDLRDFKKLKEDFKFVVPIGIGAVGGIFLFSKIIGYLLEHQRISVLYCFIGLILGSVPLLFKKANSNGFKKKYIISFIVTFGFMILLCYLNSNIRDNDQITEFQISLISILKIAFYGFLGAGTMIIPGISGSMVMMILDVYTAIINALSNLNFQVLIPFAIGMVIGVIVVSKIINKLLQKFYGYTFYSILGFVIGSIIFVFPGFSFTFTHMIGVIMLFIGFFISYSISKISK